MKKPRPHPLFPASLQGCGLRVAAAVLACVMPAPAVEVDDTAAIQRLFAQRCLECHGPDKQKGDLRLDREGSVRRVVDNGELLRRLTSSDPEERMPYRRPAVALDAVERVRRWVEAGAPHAEHWAYLPLQAAVPEVSDVSWVRNPIDRFVLARLEAEGLEPSPEADRPTLVRRLYLDLTGLPPSTAEADAFVNDPSPNAYAELVTRLLASPQFGERWGRHWLDRARYADSDGYEKDRPRPHAWHYRDWVIAAVNEDMPIDRFTIEQLAGDLLPGTTAGQRLATAFHRQTLTNTEGGVDAEEFRVEAVFDRTETTAAVWLGLTLGCARCHHHKYDAITQPEYYQFFAFFNESEETNFPLPRSVEAMRRHEAACEAHQVQVRALGERIARAEAAGEAVEALLEEKAALEKEAPKPPMDPVRVLEQRARETRVLARGDFRRALDAVEPAGPGVLPPVEGRFVGRLDRLDLARWLVASENPLTPRVLTNQVWEKLFGAGLVRTVNDFGVRGEAPTHSALLDWLAVEYRRHGWSRKRLIATVVQSATYRQQSRFRDDLLEEDPTNRLLARQNRFRVEAEIVRDQTLAAAGLLVRRIGGPSVYPPMPPEVAALSYADSFRWENSEGTDRYRRGMYTFFKRTAPHPNLMAFDCPDSNTTTLRRRRSNTPIQALTTLNNEVFVEAARHMARECLAEPAADDEVRIGTVLRRCLIRPSGDRERDAFHSLLQAGRAYYHAHPEDAARLVGPLATAAEGVPRIELAAWVTVCRTALNLDEFLTRE